MASIEFNSTNAPCGFLIVPKGGNAQNRNTVLIQSDGDFLGVASRMGFVTCECGRTDGSVDCLHQKASDMISAAIEFLHEREGTEFAALNEYLE